MNEDFYVSFEDHFRGSRNSVINKLEAYRPFLTALKDSIDTPNILDLGCGRGEWLEFTQTFGFDSKGIDLDNGMLEKARVLGLNVEQADALNYLQSLPDNSIALISGFHIVEHLPFHEIHAIIQQSLRVLRDGGLLILETPNPENIFVASSHFYLDPTHIRPIPPKLLEFLVKYHGFENIKIVRLNHEEQLNNNRFVNIMQLLGGVSPDYAVVGQKVLHVKEVASMHLAFDADYGVSFDTLALKFEHRMMFFEEQIVTHSQALHQNEHQMRLMQEEFTKQIDVFSQALQDNESKICLMQEEATRATHSAKEAWENYYAIISSRSWKITQPLRWIVNKSIWFKTGLIAWLTFSPHSRPRRVLKRTILLGIQYIAMHPKLKYRILKQLNRFPRLKQKCKRWLPQNTSVITAPQDITLKQLSPRAKEVYFEFQSIRQEIQKGTKICE